ncbi:MAG: hypothetical protein MAG551_01806 [Candidatus Scalindua arabica]|uniref:Uncharacterized protein n=1 Tax=Candidatus Scalindua arabica TaxID=1127984 RepID=A0A941W3Y6_9BACT|nr:hypothetical protein [Candidatus Scalindua arabica]
MLKMFKNMKLGSKIACGFGIITNAPVFIKMPALILFGCSENEGRYDSV